MRNKRILALLTGALLLTVPSIAQADIGWGPRFGMTGDPDQPHIGVHLDAGYLADRWRFQPNFELGLDDNNLAAFNFETIYLFSSSGSWSPYLGGGVGLFSHLGNNNSDAGAGLSGIGGFEHRLNSGNRFFTELKLGLIDAPDFKLTAGWTFTH